MAELIRCPVVGFWEEPKHREIAIEGTDRKSDFECYKAHQQFDQFDKHIKSKDFFLIYVIRDPRDIVVSGSRFFKPYKLTGRIFSCLPDKLLSFCELINKQFLRYNALIKAVCYGNQKVHSWLGVSWQEHVTPYLKNNVFYLKYENLLKNPYKECLRILEYLHVQKTDGDVLNAIERHSEGQTKRRFLQTQNVPQLNLLNVGKEQQWKTALKKAQKKEIYTVLGVLFDRLGYEKS